MYFNTSHVNVNRITFHICYHSVPISIHLMLMLIAFHVAFNPNGVYFNTSHVNVNPHWFPKNKRLSRISIHLMLMLIIEIASSITVTVFISIHLMLMLIKIILCRIWCFNFISIHLMLMLISTTDGDTIDLHLFQYISC